MGRISPHVLIHSFGPTVIRGFSNQNFCFHLGHFDDLFRPNYGPHWFIMGSRNLVKDAIDLAEFVGRFCHFSGRWGVIDQDQDMPTFFIFPYPRYMLGCGHQLRNQGQLEYLYQIRGALTPHRWRYRARFVQWFHFCSKKNQNLIK